MQRLLDVLFSLLALIVFAPVLIIIGLILRVTGEGEVIYKQQRIGKGGEPFALWKFATMLKNSPNTGSGTITVKNDPRVLPTGKFLRKTKINELPQLINVLLGDMSLIGPRPVTAKEFGIYPANVQRSIKASLPGLSGIGSIVFRGEENLLAGHSDPRAFYEAEIAPFKGELEVWYANNRSLTTYVLSIFITVWCIFFPNSGAVWKIFKSLPEPTETLMSGLNFER